MVQKTSLQVYTTTPLFSTRVSTSVKIRYDQPWNFNAHVVAADFTKIWIVDRHCIEEFPPDQRRDNMLNFFGRS